MARYINANALLIKIMDLNLDHVQGDDGRELCQVIQALPTEDVREVVLCKDCKYASSYGIEGTIFCEDMECPNLEDGFCNHAERRGDE